MSERQTTDYPPDPDKDPIGAWAWLVEDAGDRRFLDAKLRAEFGRRDAEIARLQTVIRVNALRWAPHLTHTEIDEVIRGK